MAAMHGEGPDSGSEASAVPVFRSAPERPSAWFAPATGEHPAPQSAMASWGYRVGAAATDLGLAFMAALAAAFVAALVGASDDDATIVVVVVFLAFGLLINSVLIAGLDNGQTLGKRLAGIRAVREDGGRYGIETALLRDVLCRVIYVVPLLWAIDALFALGSERQTLRDRWVGTRVLREPVYRSRRWPLTITAILLAAGMTAVLASP